MDRLAELHQMSNYSEEAEDNAKINIVKQNQLYSMPEFESLQSQMLLIEAHSKQTRQLANQYKTGVNEQTRQRSIAQVKKINEMAMKLGQQCKLKLDAIRLDEKQFQHQIVKNLYTHHLRRFQEVMTRYQAVASEFQKLVKATSKRLILLVVPTLDEKKLDEIVDTGQVSTFIQKSLMSDNLQIEVAAIESRHVAIMELERQVLEIFDLFKDLAMLVDLHQESLDHIGAHISNCKHYVEEGEVELQSAEKYLKGIGKMKCCLLFTCLAILIVILLPVLASTHSF